MKDKQSLKNNLTVPISIIIAGIMITGAVIYRGPEAEKQVNNNDSVSPSIENIKEVNKNDHIFGNPKASIKIVEFSDTECPYCKKFHVTMNQIMDEYGKDGKVAWVYRHFPLDQLHSKARKEAEATECAADIGGNTAFWGYINRMFEITPANNGLDLTKLPEIAEYVGLDRDKFEKCLNSGKYSEEVESDLQDAITSGGRGTPYSILITSDGEKVIINGAQPYESVKLIIESALKAK